MVFLKVLKCRERNLLFYFSRAGILLHCSMWLTWISLAVSWHAAMLIAKYCTSNADAFAFEIFIALSPYF